MPVPARPAAAKADQALALRGALPPCRVREIASSPRRFRARGPLRRGSLAPMQLFRRVRVSLLKEPKECRRRARCVGPSRVPDRVRRGRKVWQVRRGVGGGRRWCASPIARARVVRVPLVGLSARSVLWGMERGSVCWDGRGFYGAVPRRGDHPLV